MGGDRDSWIEKSVVIRFEPELLEEWRTKEKELGERGFKWGSDTLSLKLKIPVKMFRAEKFAHNVAGGNG